MKYYKSLSGASGIFLILFLLFSCSDKNKTFTGKRDLDFNRNWKFLRDSISGPELPGFDDSDWLRVDLPHDWSVEDFPIQDTAHAGPFYKNLPMGRDVGYLTGGTGWYRKELVMEKKDESKDVIVHFDGVQSQMTLWVNGRKAGRHVNGYTPFYVNITPYLKGPGEQNILAVRVYKPYRDSRWFTGAGIYRSVTISYLDPVHVDVWGVAVQTATENSGTVGLDIRLVNHSGSPANVEVVTDILSPGGRSLSSAGAKSAIPGGDEGSVAVQMNIDKPELWDIDDPNLYTARVRVFKDGEIVDEYLQRFGIRSMEFSAETGFSLNGKPLLLKGACMHHDNGLLGAAAFRSAERRRVRIMKDNGYNAIRTSHNPPSRYFLEACDELGMLVIDESFDAWVKPKRPNDYHLYFSDWWQRDLETMLRRDRNHPSVIMWSFGNEIQERADSSGLAIARRMIDYINSMDGSRPVTQAICRFWDNSGKVWEDTAPAFDMLDVSGYNYQWMKYEPDHKKYPGRIMFGSESIPNEAFENWQKVKKLPYVIGDFVWTGMDYIGESGIGHSIYQKKTDEKNLMLMPWPWYVAWCGDIDLVGNKKPQSYYRDILWENSKLEVLVDVPVPSGMVEKTSYWGWPNRKLSWNFEGHGGEPLVVRVYSAYPAVRLELNGRLIGEKKVSEDTRYEADFEVPYEPGTLKATGIENGEQREEKVLKTTGPVAKLKLIAEREEIPAGKGEVAFFRVEGYDEAGNLAPDSDLSMKVYVTGEAQLSAAGNASPEVPGSLQDERFRLFKGRALIVVRSTGNAGVAKVAVESRNGLKAETGICFLD